MRSFQWRNGDSGSAHEYQPGRAGIHAENAFHFPECLSFLVSESFCFSAFFEVSSCRATFETADVIKEEFPVQMINLMLKANGQKAFCFNVDGLLMPVVSSFMTMEYLVTSAEKSMTLKQASSWTISSP
jgi:hypothetical protein